MFGGFLFGICLSLKIMFVGGRNRIGVIVLNWMFLMGVIVRYLNVEVEVEYVLLVVIFNLWFFKVESVNDFVIWVV